MMRFSSFTSASAMVSNRFSSVTCLTLFCSSMRALRARSSARLRASRSSWNTRNSSPAMGTLCRPSTSTGVDGVASFTLLPRESIMARILP